MAKVLLEEIDTGHRLIVESIDAKEILIFGRHRQLAVTNYGLPLAPQAPLPPMSTDPKAIVKNEIDAVRELQQHSMEFSESVLTQKGIPHEEESQAQEASGIAEKDEITLPPRRRGRPPLVRPES